MEYFFLVLIIVAVLLILIDSRKKNNIKKANIEDWSPKIKEFFAVLNNLENHYIPYSEENFIQNQFSDLRKKVIPYNELISNFIKQYDNLHKLISNLNEEFIKRELILRKDYFDNLFKYQLTKEQRRAIITDDDNNLIIAGAGSGKTTTIIGKTKYLIDIKNVNPEEIIAISFTKAAKNNFALKLNNNKVQCSTFHKLGKDIIDEGNIKSDIAPDKYLSDIIAEYLGTEVYKVSEDARNFVNFYAYHMYAQNDEDLSFGETIELEKGYDLETLKSKCNSSKDLKTIKNEKVRSTQELIIANFLFLYGVNYVYEDKYKYEVADNEHRQYHPDFHLVDYGDVYLEHFGIDKYGRAPQYNEIEEKKYLDGVEFKRRIHKEHNTKLIETTSHDFKDYKIEQVLKQRLEANGIKLHELDYATIIKTISKAENEESNSFCRLISKFIKMFKGNNYDIQKFDEFINDAINKKNIRDIYLLQIIKKIYIYYQNKLQNDSYIDFDDMINLATARVKNSYDKKVSYIIIDEFQDISYSRYCLIKAIKEKTTAKVVAVGDDWQSIFRFSGCDLDLFVNFEKYFSHPKIMYITHNYRNCQNLINISGAFIMKNVKGQKAKKIVSKSNAQIDSAIEYFYYKNNIRAATESAIKRLKNLGCKKIAILGRNNSDITKYGMHVYKDESEIDMSKLFNYDVVFTTVHKAKGLEYDGVVVCNMGNYITGFPNKMADDPVLNYVTITKDDYLYEEERRLFYVALTRTRTKCMLLVPIDYPSIFINEVFEISHETIERYIIEDDIKLHNPTCPRCGTGILVAYKSNFDSSNFVGCSNYPKCDFKYKTDEIIKNTIKCPRCGSYMVRRSGMYGTFYGCINSPFCTQTININSDFDDF